MTAWIGLACVVVIAVGAVWITTVRRPVRAEQLDAVSDQRGSPPRPSSINFARCMVHALDPQRD
jgi:hypothetical protein